MATYTFVMTQTIVLEAEEAIEATNFHDAMAELARRSGQGALKWSQGPDGEGSTSLVRAIQKDGQRIASDPVTGAPGWWGLNGQFDIDDVPEEYLAIKD